MGSAVWHGSSKSTRIMRPSGLGIAPNAERSSMRLKVV
eukprot:CAMPEP_0206590156 /NCGR_PEP_ID=MMETSP0325_2-20121206/39411_1 /ASSEMBLY_ACC=CAM_ASM_000347 /TAXON_ID=2866 /ORGANISM="Crypthecodinium cohnii, Strain Seligo" /LENGTH=37 /DNA_ID= /DNA_START= /DNA_END= /DNA_ORIENTATION=